MCFFFSSRRRHTRCALVTGVQTCALPILCRLKTSLQADDYFCGETINYRKDGEPYAVRWIITPIMGVHGLPSHWIALLMEVTNESRTREASAAELEERAQKALRAIAAADQPPKRVHSNSEEARGGKVMVQPFHSRGEKPH